MSVEYRTQTNISKRHGRIVKDPWMIIDELTFHKYSTTTVGSSKKLVDWLSQTFKSREENPVRTLWTALVFAPLKQFSCAFPSRFKAGDTVVLENMFRTFTARTESVKNQIYWERLKSLWPSSLECRREGCNIIYTWNTGRSGPRSTLENYSLLEWYKWTSTKYTPSKGNDTRKKTKVPQE